MCMCPMDLIFALVIEDTFLYNSHEEMEDQIRHSIDLNGTIIEPDFSSDLAQHTSMFGP